MTTRHSALDLGTGALVCALMGLLACSDSGSTDPTMPVMAAAKGGGVAPPKVDEAIPNEAVQGDSLGVEILGSGFDDGSVVRFLLAGVPTSKMVVHETNYLNDSTLKVDLSVATDADPALYDIEVTTLRGKKGIGSEKFSVKLNGPPPDSIPVAADFRQSADEAVLTDGVLGDSTHTVYDAVILPIGNLFLDARQDTGRRLCLEFAGQPGAPDVVCDHGYFSTSTPDLPGGFPAMSVGSTMKTIGQVTWVKDRYNWFLRFGEEACGYPAGVDNRVVVTHPLDDTWVLKGTTACLLRMSTRGRPVVEDVDFFDMPFELTVTRK